jgi:hypothetical protein
VRETWAIVEMAKQNSQFVIGIPPQTSAIWMGEGGPTAATP